MTVSLTTRKGPSWINRTSTMLHMSVLCLCHRDSSCSPSSTSLPGLEFTTGKKMRTNVKYQSRQCRKPVTNISLIRTKENSICALNSFHRSPVMVRKCGWWVASVFKKAQLALCLVSDRSHNLWYVEKSQTEHTQQNTAFIITDSKQWLLLKVPSSSHSVLLCPLRVALLD